MAKVRFASSDELLREFDEDVRNLARRYVVDWVLSEGKPVDTQTLRARLRVIARELHEYREARRAEKSRAGEAA